MVFKLSYKEFFKILAFLWLKYLKLSLRLDVIFIIFDQNYRFKNSKNQERSRSNNKLVFKIRSISSIIIGKKTEESLLVKYSISFGRAKEKRLAIYPYSFINVRS